MIKNKVLSSSFWTLGVGVVDRFAAFIIYIVLARYLGVEEFGVVAFSILFIEFIFLVINSVVNEFIVSKDSINSTFINTCFYSVMLSAFVLIFLFYFSIDLLFYDKNSLTIDVLKALAFLPFISSFNIIQVALLQREFSFKSISLRSLLSTLLAGFVGVIMAINGFGAWALVFNKYIKVIIDTVFMLYITKFIPALEFSVEDFKNAYRFGIPLLLSEVMNFWSSRTMELFVSTFYGLAAFAILDVGRKFSKMINQVSLTPLRSVCLSYVSRSEDKGLSFLKFSAIVTIIVAPALIFIGFFAEPIIYSTLGSKWESAIVVCQILSFAALPQCLSWYFSVPLIALNKTRSVFKVNLMVFIVSILFSGVAYFVSFEHFIITQTVLLCLASVFKLYYLLSTNVFSFNKAFTELCPVITVAVSSLVACFFARYYTESFFSNDFSVSNILLLIFISIIVTFLNLFFVFVFHRKLFFELMSIKQLMS